MTAIRAIVVTALLLVCPHFAYAGVNVDASRIFIKAVDRMMVQLGPKSSRASAAISAAYRHHLDLLVLQEFTALEGALGTGGLVALPPDALRFNVKPRLDGPGPIAEKDLDNQATYIAARPAALGALFEVAARVKSGPVEVTSLVRHSEYQDELRKTNHNARTSVPTHTMGLAFDIALVNTPLKTVYEIRDVLQQMQAAGDILVIGERKQLVFHVVPHPSRLGYFNDVYARRVTAALSGANVIPAVPVAAIAGPLRPAVKADIVAVYPTKDFAQEWWAAEGAQSDLTVSVSPRLDAAVAPRLGTSLLSPSMFTRLAARCVSLVSSVVGWFHD